MMNYPWAIRTDRLAEIKAKLKDFEWYRERYLYIRPREGGARKLFRINAAQTVLNNRLNT